MKRDLVVVGASAVALQVVDLARTLGKQVEMLIDETIDTESRLEGTTLKVVNTVAPWIDDDRFDVVIAIGDNFSRQSVFERVRHRVTQDRFVNLIHPDATVSNFARLGLGSILLAGSRIGPGSELGSFLYLTANTVVAHHCALGDFVSMSPGACLAGRVTVGARSSLGMNSSVRERCIIGDDVIVGANSFVNTDAPASSILGGVPAKVLRKRIPGERYLR